MKDNAPNAGKLIQSLRSTGYNNYSAIADLVDNSLDAHAAKVSINIGGSKDTEYLLVIADDGDGMNEKTLDQAVRLGSDTDRDTTSDLGKFGMGLITASISLGKKLVVITKQYGQHLTAIHDIDEVVEKNQFIKELRPSTEQEINAFMLHTGGAMHGTVVLISKIDRLQNKNLSIFRDTLLGQLGEIFREYINAGKFISVNNKDVRARDPLMLENPNTLVLYDDIFEELETTNGEKEAVRLRVVALPKTSKAEAKELKMNIPSQGFYLMRNNRQIARGESLDVFTKHNSYNRFRAEIFFSGNLDQTLGIGFTKDEVKINDTVRSWLATVVNAHLISLKKQAHKDRAAEIDEKVDHKSSENAFKLKSKLVPDTLSFANTANQKEGSDWRDSHEAEVTFGTSKKDRLGPMFSYDVKGRKIHITYNIEHPFYQTIFGEIGDSKELTNSIDFLVYSIAAGLARITTEDNEVYIDNFLETFSSSLRTLLS